MTNSRTVLITGGSRGIGAATAELAAKAGYDVCFSYNRRQEEADAVSSTIREAGQQVLAVQANFSKEDDIVRLWEKAVQTFGKIDALVNNVGVLEQQMCLADYDAGRLQRVFAVNVIGSFLCARQAVRHMSTARGGAGGAIVNVSSVASRLGAPGEYVDYAASKAAIDAMTIGLAKEVAGEGIRVNAVRPGSIYTEIHALGGEPNRVDRVAQRIPLKRGGYPAEIAEAILWLISEKASYTTGAILDVTGGL